MRAATLDELLSDEFLALKGEKADADRAALRLAAWCRASSSGDWALFARRLAKEGLTLDRILPRIATVRRRPGAPAPAWLADAEWIWSAMLVRGNASPAERTSPAGAAQPFEQLIRPIVSAAEEELRTRVSAADAQLLTAAAWNELAAALLARLTTLCAPALYECFLAFPRAVGAAPTDEYAGFVEFMRNSGFARLFDSKPVLLRLIASVTRQWIEFTVEFITRLSVDLAQVRRVLARDQVPRRVAAIESGLSDPHNFGRSVLLLAFEDGQRVVYKPKDMRLDAFWQQLVDWLNGESAPTDLRAPKVIVKDGYGWSEFIDHLGCDDSNGVERFFFRAGASVALFHLFAATDLHEENIVACGEHPVPIDLEMLLQGNKLGEDAGMPEREALQLAIERIADSVMMTGLLPAYGRTPERQIYRWGGLAQPPSRSQATTWTEVNTSRMRPVRSSGTGARQTNLPRLDGSPVSLNRFLPSLVAGFETYGRFLCGKTQQMLRQPFVEGLEGLQVRRVRRPTRFYHLLLERLRDHRNMHDGAEWSAHMDFLARLTDLDNPLDEAWPLHRAERDALVDLNVPFFVARSDGVTVCDRNGVAARTLKESGLACARRRIAAWNEAELQWQRDVIISSAVPSPDVLGIMRNQSETRTPPIRDAVHVEAALPVPAAARDVAAHFTGLALRSRLSAAWIGLDWLGDSDVCQLSPVGYDLYGGAPGISLFLAAYSRIAHDGAAADLALAGVAPLRSQLRGAGSARFARGLGIGGATGVGSVVYALTVMGELLNDDGLLADANQASRLCSDELIAADRAFDVIGGSAGCILGLLKLYRRTGDREVLARAIRCGDHLLLHRPDRARCAGMWIGQGMGEIPLIGMSHGAAGFAFAFATLNATCGRDDFAAATRDCIDFENGRFVPESGDWQDPRRTETTAPQVPPCQWCHGAGGIGHARLGMLRIGWTDESVLKDIERAVRRVERAWPYVGDSLCCGNLGNIELLNAAGSRLGRSEWKDLATRRLESVIADAQAAGDYRWAAGSKRFNLGLFRGISGVGYTLLRQVDDGLPNVLAWE